MRLTTNNPNELPAERQLIAYNARDIEAFEIEFAPNVDLFRLLSGETFCSGRGHLREIYGKLFSSTPDLHCELTKRIVCGNVVIDEEIVTGMAGYPSLHAVAIYEIENGVIRRGWFCREE